VKRWLLRIAVVISALAVLASGSWYVWREFYSAEQFREAVKEGIESRDFSRAERLKWWGADTEKWREEDSADQFRSAIAEDMSPGVFIITATTSVLKEWEADIRPWREIDSGKHVRKGAEKIAIDRRNLYDMERNNESEERIEMQGKRVELNLKTFKCLIEWGARPNDPDELGVTPLITALFVADGHDVEVLTILIDAGADVNHRDGLSETPLHHAVRYCVDGSRKSIEAVSLLLKAGADPNLRSLYGDRPLNILIQKKDASLAKLLIRYGADPYLKVGPINPEFVEQYEKLFSSLVDLSGLEQSFKKEMEERKPLQEKTYVEIWPELAEIVKELEAEMARESDKKE